MTLTLELESVAVTPTGTSAPPEAGHGELQLLRAERAPVRVADYQTGDGGEAGLPETFAVGGLRHPQLRLRAPLVLRVEQENEWVMVWSDAVEEIGYGEHLTAAVEDFQQTFTQLYLSLKADQERLGPDLARLWQRLQELVDERP